MSVITNNEIPFEPLILESNSNPTNNWCAREILRAIHITTKISSRLINSWKNGTTSQKVMGTVIAVYCTAATAYILNCIRKKTFRTLNSLNFSH